MHVAQLKLVDFRSYASVEVELAPGVTAFVGPNGQGKTNLIEAIDYVATHASHRVAGDQPLVRAGATQAIVRTTIQRRDRRALVELEINPGRSNRARLNRGEVPRTRDVLGILRSVVFSPDDLTLVKGEPGVRRRFLDDLLVARHPRLAGVRSDYDRVLKQRNTLLKTASGRATGRRNEGALATLEVWDTHLARTGAELLAARLALVGELRPHVEKHYDEVSRSVPRPAGGNEATLEYQASVDLSEGHEKSRDDLSHALLAQIARRRGAELDRGVSLVGPHRDDLLLSLGSLPMRGYGSHGESWSFALSLRLAAFELLRATGDDPVLILDDVFAELDDVRRHHLAALIARTEQVLVTAAVNDDIPHKLVDQLFDVRDGAVTRA
ncbi:MAG: DNA replication/repair protein RecF [Nocardioidaceae bacterium]